MIPIKTLDHGKSARERSNELAVGCGLRCLLDRHQSLFLRTVSSPRLLGQNQRLSASPRSFTRLSDISAYLRHLIYSGVCGITVLLGKRQNRSWRVLLRSRIG